MVAAASKRLLGRAAPLLEIEFPGHDGAEIIWSGNGTSRTTIYLIM